MTILNECITTPNECITILNEHITISEETLRRHRNDIATMSLRCPPPACIQQNSWLLLGLVLP